MSEEKTPAPGGFKFELGKEIDAALGDVIRGLLKRPAEEAGNLLADGLGLLGDRVRRKRETNARLALEETRETLDARGIDLKDITPPEEEDLHIVLNGMSLAADDQIRNLWSNLLATALDPNNGQKIERPIISVLEALSPSDARIVEISAFISREKKSLRSAARILAEIPDRPWMTIGDENKIQEILKGELSGRYGEFSSAVLSMAREFDIKSLSEQETWADNLMRLGLITSASSGLSFDTPPRALHYRGEVLPDQIGAIVEHFSKQLEKIQENIGTNASPEFIYRYDMHRETYLLGFEFTRFGEKFCKAVGLL